MALTRHHDRTERRSDPADSDRLRVIVAGLRGVVDVQGGIETHARKLYPLLARLGCDIEIIQRSPFFDCGRRRTSWRGLRLTYLWCPRIPALETAVHTLLAVLYAAVRRPDVLHLHAIGPGYLAPLARLFGLRVVLTHHAIDHEREKWGPLARATLRAGERLGVRYAHRTICVSPAIHERIEQQFGVTATLAPNGAPTVTPATTRRVLDELGLVPGRYFLNVARLEPEKRQRDLIDAFERAGLEGFKLVLVGGIDPAEDYARALQARAGRNANVILAGYRSGAALRELYTHAATFVLPSSLEGLPIAILEAVSFGLPVIASDIPANRAVPLPDDAYFAVGDVESLTRRLTKSVSARSETGEIWIGVRATVREQYSWRSAAQLTRGAYGDHRRQARIA